MGMDPTEDDTLALNDVTVQRTDGASYRSRKLDGDMGSALLGTYPAQFTLNVETDEQAHNQSTWKLWQGTIDEARYPSLTISIAKIALNLPDTLYSAKQLDVGKVVRITDLPAWLPVDTIDLMVIGYAEEFWQYGWDMALVCVPASQWSVWQLETGEHSRLQSTWSELATGVDSDDVTWTVDTVGTYAPWIDSATYPTMFPIPMLCEGEEISVTAIVGTTSPQTFTVTRSVNGVVKAHDANADIILKMSTPIGI